jgi:mannose-6-phosphate isomerase-like protein (cupin superfamily)
MTFTAGYSTDSSIILVHAKPTTLLNEKLHYHSKDSEYFYVLHGCLTLEVEGKTIEVKEKMCLETAPKEKHKIISFISGTEYIVVRTNLLPGEKEFVE